MASTSETGHAKNVANLQTLITFCQGYGASYNPSKAAIKIPALQSLHTSAVNSLASINTVLPSYNNAINARDAAFSPLNKLITKVGNAAQASDVPLKANDDLKTIARKLQGKRATPKGEAPAADAPTPAEETPKNISSSQMSFDQRIENMDKLIQILSAQPGYTPNEADLTVAGLTTTLATMRSTNTATVTAYAPVSNARIERNKILYGEGTGLVDLVADVKSYIKSVFGATSPQYKQVSGLKFTKVKS